MGRSATCIMIAVMVYGSNGAAKKSGIEEFWTDDYKVFQQVYGKTSDKDLYGTRLPTTVIDNGDKKEASETRERYVINYNDPDSIEFDPEYDDNYNNNLFNKKKKPTKTAIDFIKHSKYKPISQASDPKVYSYLKHLEDYNKQERNHHKSTLKPYFGETSSEENDAYRSIQDIIEAHERNKRKSSRNKEDNRNYLKYLKNKKKRPSRSHNEGSKHRCSSSRCRKSGHGIRSRRPHRRAPTLKKIVVI